uniref:NR LBD domain-containing protein n=1 Tax=Steinernema glaseri TaxID=37863 RepID=A0A1I7Y840_9BILA
MSPPNGDLCSRKQSSPSSPRRRIDPLASLSYLIFNERLSSLDSSADVSALLTIIRGMKRLSLREFQTSHSVCSRDVAVVRSMEIYAKESVPLIAKMRLFPCLRAALPSEWIVSMNGGRSSDSLQRRFVGVIVF